MFLESNLEWAIKISLVLFIVSVYLLLGVGKREEQVMTCPFHIVTSNDGYPLFDLTTAPDHSPLNGSTYAIIPTRSALIKLSYLAPSTTAVELVLDEGAEFPCAGEFLFWDPILGHAYVGSPGTELEFAL